VHAASNLEVLRERMGKAYSDPDGHDAVREFYQQWAGAFSDWSWRPPASRAAPRIGRR